MENLKKQFRSFLEIHCDQDEIVSEERNFSAWLASCQASSREALQLYKGRLETSIKNAEGDDLYIERTQYYLSVVMHHIKEGNV